MSSWYNTDRVQKPGSVILQSWMAEREAARLAPQNSGTPVSEIVPGTDMYEALTGGLSFGGAGIAVTEQSAMAVGAVYACVALIGAALAAVPFHLYKRTESGRERYDSDLWWLFNESPADNWTAAAAWKFTAQCIALKGDAFWRIHRVSPFTNAIDHFEPLHPDRVGVYRQDKRTIYLVATDAGKIEPVAAADMLHFPGVGFNGIRSLTPIRAALRPAAGIALAADEYAGAFFRNGARPDFAITSDKGLTDLQANQVRTTWAQRHTGSSNAHLPAVLVGGLKVEQLTMTSEDAQLLATREFQVNDVARIFGVPAHMINATEKTTSWGSGIEQQSIGFVRYTLKRYVDDVAQEINRKIWPRSRQFFGEHSLDALLDGDSKAQAEYFNKALGGPGSQGWMCVDEVRRLKNLPALGTRWSQTVVRAGAAEKPASNKTEQSDPEEHDESAA